VRLLTEAREALDQQTAADTWDRFVADSPLEGLNRMSAGISPE